MASKPKPRPDPLYTDLEIPAQAEIDIEDFLEEWSPQTVVVEIYQHQRDGSKPHQERVGIEILKADLYGYLRENFGGGKFELQFKDANRRIRKTLTLQVGAGPKAAPAAANGKAAEGNGDYMKDLVIALIASMKPAPAPDIGGLLAGVAALIQAQKSSTSSESPSAMLQAMATTFTALKPKEADSLSQFKEMISLAKDLVPGNERPIEENMYTVIKDLGQKAVEVFTGRTGGAQQPPRTLPPGELPLRLAPSPRALPPGSAVTGETAPEAKTQQQILQEWLRVQLAYLKDKAVKRKEVDFWIDYIFVNDDEPGCAAIISAIEAGARFEDLLAFDNQIAENPELVVWFRTFYDGLRAEIVKSLDSSGADGNADHARRDASAGQVQQPDHGSPEPGGTSGKPDSAG